MKIAIIPGSARKDSVNRKLALVAASVAKELGHEVDVIDPRVSMLPLYDQDLEAEAFPAVADEIKARMKSADALVFCSPEYNSSVTPLLKNLIDWTSRPSAEGENPLEAYSGKKAALLAASPGALGGLRGLVALCSILGNIGVWVSPKQHAIGAAYGKFDDAGQLTDPRDLDQIRVVLAALG
ncbi:MAG: NAD(P)H-dependent oxidoreductase [Akkermansiaceae bacterium]|jgi:NAD(P)H-dependent FMN reductase|nr:NAD(P)H-dependent oxidoreductase [Akkermansiaceae bacterium]